MVTKELFVGIGIAVGLAVGLGVGFGFSGESLESENDSKVLDMQLVRQMMLDDPNAMQEMIMNTMQDSDQMQMMEDMMEDMMKRMQNDSELKQAMIVHMERMKESRENMMDTTDDQMMNGMMEDSMMKQSTEQTIGIDSIDFSNIRITQISDTSATIEGNTDQAVFCQVEYGTNGLFTNSASDGMDMMNMKHYKHEVIIFDLEPNTEYNYRFKASIDDQTFYSEPNTFKTNN